MIQMTDREFEQFTEFIELNYGIHLKKEKKELLVGRLYKIVEALGLRSFSEYYYYMINDQTGTAILEFLDCITTNHTFFMREAQHFEYFKRTVLPFLKQNIKDKDLRIWCAACSSGEEAYTLAMIIDEFFGQEKYLWETTLLATDLSREMIRKAQYGIYTKQSISVLPKAWQINYFMQKDKYFMVSGDIKKQVLFRRFNLMTPVFPFKKKFHVIFCRNVMIYFAPETRAKLIEEFYRQLEIGGYLFIGSSECLGSKVEGFQNMMPAVYKKV